MKYMVTEGGLTSGGNQKKKLYLFIKDKLENIV